MRKENDFFYFWESLTFCNHIDSRRSLNTLSSPCSRMEIQSQFTDQASMLSASSTSWPTMFSAKYLRVSLLDSISVLDNRFLVVLQTPFSFWNKSLIPCFDVPWKVVVQECQNQNDPSIASSVTMVQD